MDGDDTGDFSDAELLEQRRRKYAALKAAVESKRAVLEAQGMDVGAVLEELHTLWENYEQSQQEVERAEEDFLQKTANVADAREDLLQLLREGMATWQESLEQAPAGSTQRVEVWEGFTAWKAQMRTMAEAWLAKSKRSDKDGEVYRDALRVLKG